MLDEPLGNVPEFSVSDLAHALKRTVEDSFAHVRVRGEISGFKRHSSGHLYFALKDADAVLDAVCWRGQATRLGMAPEDGMEVIATGRLTTYPGRSKYQMVVERMDLAGQGALLKLLEDRKRKLAAEGLFDSGRKRPLPFLPRRIGVVTSPTGAVIRDILHRLADRFPSRVLLWPVAVQGEGAAEQVARAIVGFNALPPDLRPDLLIVARGGGSVEDLWAFNEEVVVRAAAASQIPLISAVGHETDTTLIDYASDRRAPTPTAAAEMAVPVRAELAAALADCGGRLEVALSRLMQDRRRTLDQLARALPDPRRLIEDRLLRLEDRSERLRLSLPNLLQRRQAELDRLAARLKHPRDLLQQARHQLHSLAVALDHGLKSAAQQERSQQERLRLHLAQRGQRLPAAMQQRLKDWQTELRHQGQLLDSYSYRKVLERGYAVVRDQEGRVMQAKQAQPEAIWSVEFADGSTQVQICSTPDPSATPASGGEKGRISDKKCRSGGKSTPDSRQGSLL